jgi:hypothetical protein
MLSLLLERCDATKKATKKTTEFAGSNQMYNVIVVYGRIDIQKTFPLFNLGGFTLYSLFNKSGKTSIPITPSYFSFIHMEMNLAETHIWLH